MRNIIGTTLIELITSIVIISIVITGLMSALTAINQRGADPMIIQQANAIAQAYIDEIISKGFCDPDWDPDANPATATQCRVDCTAAVCSVCNTQTGIETRATFDDICDYDGITSQQPTDQQGNSITTLSQYQVTVNITEDDSITVSGNTINSSAGQMAVVEVIVEHPQLVYEPIKMSAVRSNY